MVHALPLPQDNGEWHTIVGTWYGAVGRYGGNIGRLPIFIFNLAVE
jgi:hypothetical protein